MTIKINELNKNEPKKYQSLTATPLRFRPAHTHTHTQKSRLLAVSHHFSDAHHHHLFFSSKDYSRGWMPDSLPTTSNPFFFPPSLCPVSPGMLADASLSLSLSSPRRSTNPDTKRSFFHCWVRMIRVEVEEEGRDKALFFFDNCSAFVATFFE